MCERIENESGLHELIVKYSDKLTKKFDGSDGKKHIVVCGGTGCLSSNSHEILVKLQELIKERGIEDKVEANVVGCFGFCSQGPFVKIFPDDRLYRMVKIGDAERIIDEDIIGGKCIEELLYEDPATHQKVEKQEDINFYKKQKRIALHGCSMINPEILEEALGYGAFKGLVKALHMSQQEVVTEVLNSGIRGRGGAGFPSGRKWQFALDQKNDTKYVVCNGDDRSG